MRILIVGCGYIGSVLAKAVHEMPEVEKIFITDKSRECANNLAKKVIKAEYVDNDLESMARVLPEVDLVVEAASYEAVRYFVPLALESGVDVMVMSVGAFAEDAFRERMFSLARQKHARIYIPSGAICGTDGLHAASAAKIDDVHIVTRKSPAGFRNNEYLAKKGIDVEKVKEPTVAFEGSARDAAAYFPKNLNVAATASMLGLGMDRTKVTLIIDPTVKRNSHTLIVKGDFGELRAETQNVPSPKNPSTSYLAALSAVAALKRIIDGVWIGI